MKTENKTTLISYGALLVSGCALGLSAWSLTSVGAASDPVPQVSSWQVDAARPVSNRASEAAAVPAVASAKTATPAAKKPKLPGLETATKPTATSAAVRVKRIVVTTAISDREPVAVRELVADEGPVYAFVELENPSGEDRRIVVTFEQQDGAQKVGHIELGVPAQQARWRTWGRSSRVTSPGGWAAVVRTPEGKELGRETFEVSPS